MTKGAICAVVCPMLEDELVYSLAGDSEEKSVYLVDNQYAHSVKPKMDRNGVKYVLIREEDLEDTVAGLDRERFNFVIIMNHLGLHEEPKELKKAVESQLLGLDNGFDVIALYYGLCGNYGWDITEWARGNMSTPVIVFRDADGNVLDDCIGVAVGGCSQYLRLLKTYTGMLLLTPSMATNWEDFQSSMELFRGMDMSDKETTRTIFEMAGYKYGVKIDTGIGDRENYDRCAQEVCDESGLELIQGDPSWGTTALADKIYSEAKGFLS